MAININIDSQIVTQTLAQWGADTTVYNNNTLLFVSDLFYGTTDQMKFKKSNGVDDFANLDYMPIGGGASTDSILVEYSHTNATALADAQDYFISAGTTMGNTINSSVLIPIPSGVITDAYIATYNGSTFGSSEDCIIDILTDAGATVNNISNTIKFDARHNYYHISGLSIPVNASGSSIRLITPAFNTNPNAAKLLVNLKITI